MTSMRNGQEMRPDDELDGYELFLRNTARFRARIRSMKTKHWQTLIALVSLVVATIYVALTYGLLVRATNAAEIANRQLELTDRPSLSVDLTFPSPTRLLNELDGYLPR